jgi:hypothetical protein
MGSTTDTADRYRAVADVLLEQISQLQATVAALGPTEEIEQAIRGNLSLAFSMEFCGLIRDLRNESGSAITLDQLQRDAANVAAMATVFVERNARAYA